VSLYYDKAWWDNEEKSWVSESFHIVENVTLYDRERYARRRKAGGPAAGCSSFSWNEIVFQNFSAGYLKKLDLRVYRSFRSAVARRLYRFTDKRFYKKNRWEFDLKTLCFDKLGMARTDHTGELKRRLNAGLRELEEHGIIRRLPFDERYRKDGLGRWTVVMEKSAGCKAEPTGSDHNLVEQLIERGLSRGSAEAFVRERAYEMIAERIKLHDWLVERRDRRVSRRPAGFLAQSIRHEYPLPEDFLGEHRRSGASLAEPNREGRKAAAANDKAPASDPDRERCLSFIAGLSLTERERLEGEALAASSRIHAESYERLQMTEGPLFEQIREEVLISYVRSQDFSSKRWS
jgi:hypothetical protein